MLHSPTTTTTTTHCSARERLLSSGDELRAPPESSSSRGRDSAIGARGKSISGGTRDYSDRLASSSVFVRTSLGISSREKKYSLVVGRVRYNCDLQVIIREWVFVDKINRRSSLDNFSTDDKLKSFSRSQFFNSYFDCQNAFFFIFVYSTFVIFIASRVEPPRFPREMPK